MSPTEKGEIEKLLQKRKAYWAARDIVTALRVFLEMLITNTVTNLFKKLEENTNKKIEKCVQNKAIKKQQLRIGSPCLN